MESRIETLLRAVTWYGHSCFKFVIAGRVMYVDPFQLQPPLEPADIVLISHEHFDHCSPRDLRLVLQPSTTVVAAASCDVSQIAGTIRTVRVGDRVDLDGVVIETVPAYNLGKPFHPAGQDRVGFIINAEGYRIYHAGDTDDVSELRQLPNIDIALVPVSGTYVMTADEAAKLVNAMRPKLAIPMHYGSIVGDRSSAQRFAELANVAVQIAAPAK